MSVFSARQKTLIAMISASGAFSRIAAVTAVPWPSSIDVVVVYAAVVADADAAGDAADVRMRREDAAVDDRDANALAGELAQVHSSLR